MKNVIAQAVVALAIVTSFTVSAEAQPVVSQAQGITVTSTVSAVGVLSRS